MWTRSPQELVVVVSDAARKNPFRLSGSDCPRGIPTWQFRNA